MYPIIEPPPNLILELDVNTLSYSDFQFIHSDDMHHLQDYFYNLDGFVKAANIIKMKRIDEIAKGIKYNKEKKIKTPTIKLKGNMTRYLNKLLLKK